MKDLTGKGKPFHSALDKAAGLLKRKVGTGAEFMQELKGLGGIKQAEIDERKLGEVMGMPRMTHDQFMANLATRPVPAIKEKVLGEQVKDNKTRNQAWDEAYEDSVDDLISSGLSPDQARREALELADERINEFLPQGETQEHRTYHGQYTLPGGKNYREMLIKAPEPQVRGEKLMELEAKLRRAPPEKVAHYESLINKLKNIASMDAGQFEGVPQHFGGEPGILASMRLKDRAGPNGEKLLHLEELQSDWHQQGRERGYGSNWQVEQDEGGKYVVMRNGKRVGGEGFDNESMAQRAMESGKQNDNVVPDAPFKKNWEEMALKRLVHHAAENGYHGIVITPGAEQADRYSLAKHIDRVELEPNTLPNKETHPYYFLAYDKNGRRVADDTANEQKLQEYLGKDVASKLLSSEPTGQRGARILDNANLVTGGEGMKGFYDKKVPNILNNIGKKYGVKTELGGHTIQGRGRERSTSEFGQAIRDAGHNIHDLTLEQQKEFDYEPKPIPTHYFPITEDMRKDITTNGLPLYAEGGIIRKAEGGNVQPSLAQMKLALGSKVTHPTSKTWGSTRRST
jgi:hypothetical protein